MIHETAPPSDAARALIAQALHLRGQQDMERARDTAAQAARLAPDDAQSALVYAHLSYETWQPAADLFARAAALAPATAAAQLPIIRAHALALNAEGAGTEAQDLLANALARQPDWVEGHRALSTMRLTAGEGADFARSFGTGLAALAPDAPGQLALRLAWFHTMATARHWGAARAILSDARSALGEQRGLTLAGIFLASESDSASTDPHLFDGVADVRDVGLDLCATRFWLRNGDPARAAHIAQRHVADASATTPAARTFWPYLSLCWRLLGDDRQAWLDGAPPFVSAVDLALDPADLAALAATLRGLLTLKSPFADQSVRGGVQTDRHLFFNPDPAIQNVRALAAQAVRDYVSALPSPTSAPAHLAHPLLSPPRNLPLTFEGSWSVLLGGQGFHASHTHVMGWISSALYVDLPPAPRLGPAPAGWLSFGSAPPELGLALPPLAQVEPQSGRLALFPSTLWHGTLPFNDGERLTIAFDVAHPRIG